MHEIRFAGCTVRVFPERQYVETVFPDGAIVPAAPMDTESYRQEARDSGYGDDTWRLCAEHELTHHMLAEYAGLPNSPILRAVASGEHPDGGAFGDEERRVMQFQKRLNEMRRALNCPGPSLGFFARS